MATNQQAPTQVTMVHVDLHVSVKLPGQGIATMVFSGAGITPDAAAKDARNKWESEWTAWMDRLRSGRRL